MNKTEYKIRDVELHLEELYLVRNPKFQDVYNETVLFWEQTLIKLKQK